MKNNTKYIILIVASLFWMKSEAQQLPLFSQYYYNPFIYNPAFTGTAETNNAYLIHRSQWKDMPGSPTTYALTIDGNVKEKEIGLGLSLFNDQTDIFSRTGLYGSYSYHLPLQGDHHIYLGLSAGIIDNKIDFSRANVTDVNDPLLYNTNRRKVTTDATFGVSYFWKDLTVGFSVPQLLGTKINYDEDNTNVYMRLRRHFIGSVMYNIEINEDFDFIPSIMTRAAKGTPFQFDVNANFAWKDMVRAGLFYRFGYAAGMNLGVKLNKNLTAGYSFEYVISPIGNFSGGGHEIMLGYSFMKHDPKKIKDLEMKLEQAKSSNDSLAGVLNKKDKEHDEEIEKLKQAIKDVETAKASTGNTDGNNGNNTAEKEELGSTDVRKEKVADYQDEDGKEIPKGYYVVIESFKKKENAQNCKKAYADKQIYMPKIIYNRVRGFYYVSVFYTDDQTNAQTVMEVIQKEKADVWIFDIQ
jgi:type IX secretion system PorP/SprF family membrane protein